MKHQLLHLIFLATASFTNAQTIPKSINKPTTPKPQKASQKVVVIQKPVYIVKNNDRDGDGISDAIDECPDEKGSLKNSGCPETIVSIALPEMIAVAGGSFTMGGSIHEHEKPRHNVTLSSFSMAKTETTVAQWRAYCNATGQAMPETPSWGWTDKAPIVNVSWEDVVAYCEWLSDKTGKTYRLPTEAEWEYAARGGNKSNGYEYAGSNAINEVGWNDDNSGMQTKPCGLKRPNELGLYDMTGNVWEWCQDWYGSYGGNEQTNPSGAKTGSNRVLRGGSWYNATSNRRVAYRSFSKPGDRSTAYGFRVVVPQ
jgi:sulfatase modifying factor 1